MSNKVLLAGESWMSYTTHVKGFDSFYTSKYETGEKWIKNALENGGYEVNFLPNHLAGEYFPFKMSELKEYSCIILSDIGSNTLLLSSNTFEKSLPMPNRCELIKDYVLDGGSLLMIGGYMTFSGVDAKGKWGMTPVQDVLPVKIINTDDRKEHPEGIKPVLKHEHDALKHIKGEWPHFLGYNFTIPLEDADIPITIDADPLIAFCEKGKGRSAVFTSDCAPHWGPPEFIEWKYYNFLWNGILDWLTKK
ncbi:MAG TPA: glutamine amidotransferase [Flexilinea sp.]|jgi:uncharacterized membrane protein|nr:glutamine amidotransferase [Flexilinea sp.]HPR71623.1 glutamine amidotransferase [Flexilinea sp.]HQF36900.1 glutamine amidotransferase [Candidatus Dojkabacteria bacterium]